MTQLNYYNKVVSFTVIIKSVNGQTITPNNTLRVYHSIKDSLSSIRTIMANNTHLPDNNEVFIAADKGISITGFGLNNDVHVIRDLEILLEALQQHYAVTIVTVIIDGIECMVY